MKNEIIDYKDDLFDPETNRKALKDANEYINKYADDNNLSMYNYDDAVKIKKELMKYFGYDVCDAFEFV